MKPGERKACEACGVAIVGAAATNGGSVSPVEVEPHRAGNVLLFKDPADGVVKQATLNVALAGQLAGLGVPLRKNHFANCPEAERFRHGR